MLRYKTKTRPGIVALYDIRPGNGAGPFLQPGARTGRIIIQLDSTDSTTHSYSSIKITSYSATSDTTSHWHVYKVIYYLMTSLCKGVSQICKFQDIYL